MGAIKERFASLEEVEGRLGPLSAVVVQEEKGVFFIHGQAINLKRDVFPNSSYARSRLKLLENGAKQVYGQDRVIVINQS